MSEQSKDATKTAPDSCPFCGAGVIMEDGSECRSMSRWVTFQCFTNWHPNFWDPRVGRSFECIEAERERLTRERDEARQQMAIAIADRDSARGRAEQVWKLREEFVALLGTDYIQEEVEAVQAILARVKRLEKDWAGWPDLQREWFGDKYAAMQPLEAVRARIEDSEARIKRLEEAGDEVVEEDNIYDRRIIWRKATAEEAKEAKL